jgi:hypothetical protein
MIKGCQIKTYTSKIGVSLSLLPELAGDESAIWHTLLKDFLIVARKLEKLGFIYSAGSVIVNDQYVDRR